VNLSSKTSIRTNLWPSSDARTGWYPGSDLIHVVSSSRSKIPELAPIGWDIPISQDDKQVAPYQTDITCLSRLNVKEKFHG
jgi:hypothetical protein